AYFLGSTGSGASYVFDGNVTTTGPNSAIFMSSDGNATYTTTSGSMVSDNVFCKAIAGNVSFGVGGGTSLVVNTPALSVNNVGTGTMNINDLNTGSLTTYSPFAIGGSATLNSAAPTTFNGLTTTAGSINLIDSSGRLFITGNVTANGGTITFQNTDTTSGMIEIGSNLTVATNNLTPSNGTVTMYIGASLPTFNAGTQPSNTTLSQTGGAVVQFGSSTGATTITAN